MTKVISFLGPTTYKNTTYAYQGMQHSTCFFPAAVASFVKPEQMFICVTPTVRKHENFSTLGSELDALGISWQPLDIPEGRSEAELWEIFDRITNAVNEGEQVTFDVTHSFRSLPMLVFLAVAFLKAAKNVQVKQVLYGAWEARDQETNLSPVFDLTPFASLLDWLTAANQFIQTGNAHSLAELMNSACAEKGPAAKASQTLSRISQAAMLCQPFSLMQSVKSLQPDLDHASQDLQELARPFSVLSVKINSAYRSFEADYKENVQQGLKAEFDLVQWYFDKNLYIQALSLAREWMIDVVTYRLDRPIDFRAEMRSPMERAVSGISLVNKPFTDSQTKVKRQFTVDDLNEPGRVIYLTWAEKDLIIQTWSLLSPIRNALDHAEHQVGAMKMKIIQKNVRDVQPLLQELADLWQITSERKDEKYLIP